MTMSEYLGLSKDLRRYVVTQSDVLATSVFDHESGAFWRGRVLVRLGKRQLLVDNAEHGGSPERAIAFAMRKMADVILAEYPRP